MKWPVTAPVFDHIVFFDHPACLVYLGGFKYSESTKPISTMIGNATMNSTISRFRFFVVIYK
jgi:hypothetical protein